MQKVAIEKHENDAYENDNQENEDNANEDDVVCYNTECNNREKLRRCTGCYDAYYCSVKCQTEHWRKHKTHCKQKRKQNASSIKKRE
mmetsp:Transcript_44421/g.71150  ORF Transcript_44421/g.71150 Transcript_44421/m.71150 type:complete len:87 (+) Transcript_44421:14-274(+)